MIGKGGLSMPGKANYEELEKRVQELEKAASVEHPDGIILDHLGDALAKVGNVSQALESWDKAIETLEGGVEHRRVSEIREKIKQHRSE